MATRFRRHGPVHCSMPRVKCLATVSSMATSVRGPASARRRRADGPIIGRTPVEHLYLNVGHGALGWTLAAGSARLVCDAIAGRTPTIDVKPLRYQ